jgi:hypothetical protein
VAVQALDVLGLESHDTKALIDSFATPIGSAVRSPEEIAPGLVEIPEGLLLKGDRAFGHPWHRLPELGELPSLLEVAGSRLESRLPVVPLLQRQVPDVTGMGAMSGKGLGLGGCRIKAKTHSSIVRRGTDRKEPVLGSGVKNFKFGGPQPRSQSLAHPKEAVSWEWLP